VYRKKEEEFFLKGLEKNNVLVDFDARTEHNPGTNIESSSSKIKPIRITE
jgi:hypothetical protein